MTKPSKTPFKQYFLTMVLLVVLLVVSFPIYYLIWNASNYIKEKIIEKEFKNDVHKISQVKVKNFMLWEGDSMVTLNVKNKGDVRFWYGEDKIPNIDAIQNIGTTFDCYFLDTNNKKIQYAYTVNLDLSNDTLFSKWFSFRVNSLSDLVKNYNNIVSVLQTFPKNPELINFKDSYGERQIIKNQNKEFLIKTTYKKKPVECDLFLLTN